jgi:hypothetical protein
LYEQRFGRVAAESHSPTSNLADAAIYAKDFEFDPLSLFPLLLSQRIAAASSDATANEENCPSVVHISCILIRSYTDKLNFVPTTNIASPAPPPITGEALGSTKAVKITLSREGTTKLFLNIT